MCAQVLFSASCCLFALSEVRGGYDELELKLQSDSLSIHGCLDAFFLNFIFHQSSTDKIAIRRPGLWHWYMKSGSSSCTQRSGLGLFCSVALFISGQRCQQHDVRILHPAVWPVGVGKGKWEWQRSRWLAGLASDGTALARITEIIFVSEMKQVGQMVL